MTMKEELQAKLESVRKDMKVFLGDRKLTDEEAGKLESLNADARSIAAKLEAIGQQEAAEAEQVAKIAQDKEQAVKAAREEERANARRLAFNAAPYVAKFGDTDKYDNLDAAETALVIDVLKSKGKEVSGSAYKALSLKVGELKNDDS